MVLKFDLHRVISSSTPRNRDTTTVPSILPDFTPALRVGVPEIPQGLVGVARGTLG